MRIVLRCTAAIGRNFCSPSPLEPRKLSFIKGMYCCSDDVVRGTHVPLLKTTASRLQLLAQPRGLRCSSKGTMAGRGEQLPWRAPWGAGLVGFR